MSECRQQTLPKAAGKVRGRDCPSPAGSRGGSALSGVCGSGTAGARSGRGRLQLPEKAQVSLFPPEPREPDTSTSIERTAKKEQELTCSALALATAAFVPANLPRAAAPPGRCRRRCRGGRGAGGGRHTGRAPAGLKPFKGTG